MTITFVTHNMSAYDTENIMEYLNEATKNIDSMFCSNPFTGELKHIFSYGYTHLNTNISVFTCVITDNWFDDLTVNPDRDIFKSMFTAIADNIGELVLDLPACSGYVTFHCD